MPNPAHFLQHRHRDLIERRDLPCLVGGPPQPAERPQTISASYGNYEKFYPIDYAYEVCLLFVQLGARSASVLFASGNHGVGEGDCKTDGGTVRFMLRSSAVNAR
ncbi:hypothetical protein EDB86DRAFT_2980451 [Lactarius hatsudake]|nr:hypothetical protein EDB86DRAFT_2980451 [Lactarius hatsudake]